MSSSLSSSQSSPQFFGLSALDESSDWKGQEDFFNYTGRNLDESLNESQVHVVVPEGIHFESSFGFMGKTHTISSSGQLETLELPLQKIGKMLAPLFNQIPPLPQERLISGLQSTVFKICYSLSKESAFENDKAARKIFKELYHQQRRIFYEGYCIYLYSRHYRREGRNQYNPITLYRTALLMHHEQLKRIEMIDKIKTKILNKQTIVNKEEMIARLDQIGIMHPLLLDSLETRHFNDTCTSTFFVFYGAPLNRSMGCSFNPADKIKFFKEQMLSKLFQLKWEIDFVSATNEPMILQISSKLTALVEHLKQGDFVRINAILYELGNHPLVQKVIEERNAHKVAVSWDYKRLPGQRALEYERLADELTKNNCQSMDDIIKCLLKSKKWEQIQKNNPQEIDLGKSSLELTLFELLHLISLYATLVSVDHDYEFINYDQVKICEMNRELLSPSPNLPLETLSALSGGMQDLTFPTNRFLKTIASLQRKILQIVSEQGYSLEKCLTQLKNGKVEAEKLSALSNHMSYTMRSIAQDLKSMRQSITQIQNGIAINLANDSSKLSIEQIISHLETVNSFIENAFGPLILFCNSFESILMPQSMKNGLATMTNESAPTDVVKWAFNPDHGRYNLFVFQTNREALLSLKNSLQKALEGSSQQASSQSSLTLEDDSVSDMEFEENEIEAVSRLMPKQSISSPTSPRSQRFSRGTVEVDLSLISIENIQSKIDDVFSQTKSEHIIKEVMKLLQGYSIWCLLKRGGRHQKLYVGKHRIPIALPSAKEWKKGTQEAIKKDLIQFLQD